MTIHTGKAAFVEGLSVRWGTLYSLLVLHAGAIWGLWYLNFNNLIWIITLWILTGMIGITVGYHRLSVHRSFETFSVVRAFHLLCAALSFQRGPISWARHHLAHHKHADSEADPYYSNYGFIFNHIGWVIFRHKSIGRSNEMRHLPAYVTHDKLNVFFEKYNMPIFLLSYVTLYFIGGLALLLTAGALRTVLVLHFTWLVNSFTHKWGYQNFKTADRSTNSFLVSFLTFGEGWHNNHHKFPTSARQGLKWWEVDPSWMWIYLLSKVGLAWNIKRPNGMKLH